MRLSTVFHRPKTLKLSRTPKYPRKSIPHEPRLDAHKVIIHPLNTESAMKKIEEDNTLVFICDVKANKYGNGDSRWKKGRLTKLQATNQGGTEEAVRCGLREDQHSDSVCSHSAIFRVETCMLI